LKNNNLGRLTFAPLDSVRLNTIDQTVLQKLANCEGYIGIANGLIENDPAFDQLFKAILGQTIIANNLANAMKIFEAVQKRHRVVTLDGDVISTVGTMTGGKMRKNNTAALRQELTKISHTEIQKQQEREHLQTRVSESYKRKQEITYIIDLETQKMTNALNELSMLRKEQSNFDQNGLDSGNELTIVNENNELIKLRNNLDIALENLKNQINKTNSEKEIIQTEYRSNENYLKTLYERENENSRDLSKYEINLQNNMDRLMSEYELTYELSFKESNQDIDFEVYKAKVVELRQQIKNLGNINLDAIIEYDEQKVRFTFLDDQRQDLLNAIEKLNEIIAKLDVHYIERFVTSYKKLKQEFKIIYQELFGGGKADLILTDPNNILETGVEILAQPPGKKLQTISLLSGGEKALTAIALLFARLRVKPVPYVILDEVEAALDESNVRRYAKYIKIFSKNVQFVVITHRQGTMEEIDRLYGVTMQEKGVSIIVDIKFEEIKNNTFGASNV